MEESRMDRIEKGMAEFFQGMKEMREEFFQEMKEMRAKSSQEMQEMRARSSQEMQEMRAKSSQEMQEMREFQKETGRQIRELKESQKKTDAQLEKTIKKLDRIGEQLGDLGLVQGKVAEDLFYRNVKSLFRERDLIFGSVRRNVRKKGVAEYDIVASGGDRVLVIEVKNRLEKRMVDRFVSEKMPNFKKFFPQYKDCSVLGGVGALVMQDDVGRYAEKKGLYVLTRRDGGANNAVTGFQARSLPETEFANMSKRWKEHGKSRMDRIEKGMAVLSENERIKKRDYFQEMKEMRAKSSGNAGNACEILSGNAGNACEILSGNAEMRDSRKRPCG
ncbi:MAG: hypothetical protein R2941_19705 [Desulfobacterales bacterium]